MSCELSESGQATALVLVGFIVLAIPAGLAIAQGLTTSPTAMDTARVVTPTLPPVNLTATPTPTQTPTPTPEGDDTDNDGNATTGQTHFVNAGGGLADDVTSEEGCSGANYTSIQEAVNAAGPGETVVVCAGTYSEHVEVTTANLTIRPIGIATITNANDSAVWINASGVTLQGFNIHGGEGANYAIEVGGKDAVIKNNIVDASKVGIFLSDGDIESGECQIEKKSINRQCDQSPQVDPALGTATRGRVLNNSVNSGNYGIWVDADTTVVQNNFLTHPEPNRQTHPSRQRAHPGFSSTADHTLFLCQGCEYHNTTLIASGNDTVIRGNTIRDENTESAWYYHKAGIQLGKTPRQGHNMALNNTVVGNSVEKAFGTAIRTRMRSSGAIIEDNTITAAFTGIFLFDGAMIRNNRIIPSSENCDFGREGIEVQSFWKFAQRYDFDEDWHQGKEVVIKNNTLDGGQCFMRGVEGNGKLKVVGNTIKNFLSYGVQFNICMGGEGRAVDNTIVGQGGLGGRGIQVTKDKRGPCKPGWQSDHVEILNNELTDNQHGIRITDDGSASQIEIHGNVINNNADLGINNQNNSIIVEATNNIWSCGGPSGGADPLADPYTGRLANGSGDIISAGNGSTRNGHPISNVHFDPFQVLASCPEPGSTPTATLTPTPTASRTPTPTPTATPTPPAEVGSGNGTIETGGNGGGAGTGGEGSGGKSSGGDGASEETATPPMAPTPVVEPGFRVGAGALGVVLLVSLVALRRRTGVTREETHD